jgi:AcrR family transcriptional regulator
MGTAERREREKQETRERILDAARELFAREGYEAVSMRRIAERIEYSATALYFHFEDKEALFRELCHTDFLTLAHGFQELAAIRDPIDRLQRIGLAYVRFGIEHPNHYRLMFMTPHPPVPAQEQAAQGRGNPEQDAYAFFAATIRECIASGRLRPEFDDPDQIAQMLWAATHGVVALHIVMGKDDWVDWRPVLVTAEVQIETLTRGMLRDDRRQP